MIFAKRSFSDFKSEKHLRSAIVKCSFINAQKHGFNDNCIAKACEDLGYPSVSTQN